MLKRLLIALSVGVSMLLIPPAGAQSTFGSIRGTAQDQTGAVLPQAHVTLHSVDENVDFSTLTDNEGNFLFQNVKAGNYRLTGAKEGFAGSIVDKVELAARQEIRLDMKFAVAAAISRSR